MVVTSEACRHNAGSMDDTPVQSRHKSVQGGRGGKGLVSGRQKVTKHKGPDLAS